MAAKSDFWQIWNLLLFLIVFHLRFIEISKVPLNLFSFSCFTCNHKCQNQLLRHIIYLALATKALSIYIMFSTTKKLSNTLGQKKNKRIQEDPKCWYKRKRELSNIQIPGIAPFLILSVLNYRIYKAMKTLKRRLTSKPR